MRKSFLVAAIIVAASVSVPASANHFAPVTVKLDVSILHDDVNYAGCTLTVARDHQGHADGFDVLDEAVRRGCIDSYDSVDFGSFGRFLTCIDDICGQDAPTWAIPAPTAYVGTTWEFTVNSAYASAGLDTYSIKANDEIGLTYNPYAFPA